MKKFFLFSLTAVLLICCNQSALDSGLNESAPEELSTRISIQQAEVNLLSILNNFDSGTTRGADVLFAGKKVASKYTRGSLASNTRTASATAPTYYVFNFEDNGGYAIMSADTRMPDLLVLTYEGSLEEGADFDSPGASEMFASIDAMFSIIITDSLTVDTTPVFEIVFPQTYIDTSYTYLHYSMLNDGCPVKWGQGISNAPISNDKYSYLFHYNSLCPMVGSYYCKAGCVPVGFAQFMAVHRFGVCDIDIDWELITSELSIVDFSTDDPTDASYEENAEAKYQIAYLLQLIGNEDNFNAEYALSGTGAETDDAPYVFPNFGFTSGGYYTTDQTALFTELMNGYPVLMNGYPELSDVGHCWLGHKAMQEVLIKECKLMDGTYVSCSYVVSDYVLCNFGWNGVDDGYYLLGTYNTEADPIYDEDFTGLSFNDESVNTSAYFQVDCGGVVGVRQ